jgi:hypothetical protein
LNLILSAGSISIITPTKSKPTNNTNLGGVWGSTQHTYPKNNCFIPNIIILTRV